MSAAAGTKTQLEDQQIPVDLSIPDSSGLIRGRSLFTEALWFFFGSPVVASRLIPFSGLRVFLLRLFGATIGSNVYMKPGIRVKFPWYLHVGDHCWIGEDVWIDNLTTVTAGPHVCISQGAYLCTGNHDWSARNMRLFLKPIRLEAGSWIGARSVVCPGVTVGQGGVLTVGSVAAKDIAPFTIHTGNPATFTRTRVMRS